MTVRAASRSAFRSSSEISASSAISSSVGARSSCSDSAFSARATLRCVRTRLIGSLIVRALASIPRSTAWRIHHVAYVENR